MLREQLWEQGKKARQAARELAVLSSADKNKALEAMAVNLLKKQQQIIAANEIDMKAGREKGLSKALLDRLLLTENRIADMAQGLKEVAALPDPVGEIMEMVTRPNGLQVGRQRVPLGVVGIIYEARPNVTVDAAGLCLKTGNAVLLRGGSEAFQTNQVLVGILEGALREVGLPETAVQLVKTTEREAVDIMLKMHQYLDVLIPRGGAGLIRHVVENATVPVIETGTGNCHGYIDAAADLEQAVDIVINAKCQRPGVCNALETLLVHREVAPTVLPPLAQKLQEAGVELRGCPATQAILPQVKPATEEDWSTEYLDLILAVKVVDSYREAIEHIHRYSTGHSEMIITEDYNKARDFLQRVDAAAVYVNASTRFTDGNQFGFGAEIGISTQKLHARGPMGLRELTTYKFIILGNGQIRG
ncbi:MAG: glutamate-5-semialdehyde dehydrogenase [Clostridia bacterium]|nr:glutamate-5-semialdehyde dehydrogenase [Clostridia bacterium]